MIESFPELTTERLHLTEIHDSDLGSVFELFSTPEVVKYYDLEVFQDVVQAENLLQLFHSRYQSASGIRWAIRLPQNGKLIGTCGFNSWNEAMRNASIGYDLMPEYWSKGFATEAVKGIVQAAFLGQLPCGSLHRIQADTMPGNQASEKVLLKLGFKEEGVRRDCLYIKGQYVNLKCFGLLKSEFRN
ncbi:MAG: GNAT family N-acetyltransferase [Gammaproteobacteria bacterium]|nr:GNAT family N-acetyltransferase [Gammaproteobacteria bacterium]MDH5803501.1 GNAT family N-acetyltransferase [Gammaproteobacteria bacterium]